MQTKNSIDIKEYAIERHRLILVLQTPNFALWRKPELPLGELSFNNHYSAFWQITSKNSAQILGVFPCSLPPPGTQAAASIGGGGAGSARAPSNLSPKSSPARSPQGAPCP